MNETTNHCCRICGNETNNRAFHVREMMFGWKDVFEYFECADCGCVQIAAIPDDLDKYYPTDYYAFGKPGHTGTPSVSWWRKLRNRALLGGQQVPTARAIKALAAACGLRIERVFFDSDAQQIIGSELFRLDIPLREASRVTKSMFRAEELAAINLFVKELNARRDGDCAGFVMRPIQQS